MNQRTETPIIIYQDADKAVEVRLDTGQETVWLSQAQMADLFGRDQSVVSRHIRTVFTEGELERTSTMQKMHIANSDKPVEFYNLDVIISVGYRVKSHQGTRFRQWATRTLRDHLTRGWTLNRAARAPVHATAPRTTDPPAFKLQVNAPSGHRQVSDPKHLLVVTPSTAPTTVTADGRFFAS
jgi:hypothetical protein